MDDDELRMKSRPANGRDVIHALSAVRGGTLVMAACVRERSQDWRVTGEKASVGAKGGCQRFGCRSVKECLHPERVTRSEWWMAGGMSRDIETVRQSKGTS